MSTSYVRAMTDAILGPLEHLMTSWWVYAALFGLCAVDALVPVFPSEAPLILAGVYAASDPHGPNVVLVVLVSALGACLGDHLSYGLGHLLGTSWLEKPKRRRTVERVRGVLHQRGSWALLVVRFIPGGRCVATLSLGATGYPLRSFTPYDLLATLVWAVHGTVIGYIGGHAFEDNPIAGIATGMGIAIVLAGLLEWRRHHAEKRSERSQDEKEPSSAGAWG